MKALSRRHFLAGAGGVTAAAWLAACTGAIPPITSSDSTAVQPDGGISGELTIDMQYVPGQVTADTPVPLNEILNIAEEYQTLHPGVTITFEEPYRATEAMNQPTYFKAGAEAGTLPDISFAYELSFIYTMDVIVPTTQYLEEGNDYIPSGQPGNVRWIDQWFEDVQPQHMSNGDTYEIPVGWGGPGLVIGYNREQFDQIGATTLPQTYHEYYHLCESILAKGLVPCESSLLSWEWDRMVEYLVRAMDLFELLDIDEDNWISDLEGTRGAIAGLVRFDSPYWAEPTRIWKAATRYYQPGYLQMAQTTSAIGFGEVFLTEQSAMVWNAAKIWPRLMANGGPEKWGVFNLPTLTDALTPYAAADPVRLLARTTESKTITKSAQDRGNVELAVDFLKFMTTPENSARLVQERQSQQIVLPTQHGMESLAVDKDVAQVLRDYEAPHTAPGFSSDRIGDWHFWYEWFAAIQGYFADDLTLEEMTQVQIDVLPKFIDQIIADKGWQDQVPEWEALQAEYATPPWGEYQMPSEPWTLPA